MLPVQRPRPSLLSSRLGLAALAALLIPGCSLRDDPHYNRFAPRTDKPVLTQRADDVMNAANRGVDNAAQRLDNIID